jgi:tRNA (guanosine-2'-O-)-methyltransferase
MNFPFESKIAIGSNRVVSAARVVEVVGPLLAAERRTRIEQVIHARNFSCSVVLENIYDRGNASAVMRTAEGLGFGQIHLIEKGEKLKESQRTTAGADKWLEIKRWKSSQACIDHLKSSGIQIVATHLGVGSKPIAEIDFKRPTAFVLGNEKEGISPEMIEQADCRVILPMVGFVQSYNISVAAAMGLYHIYQAQHSEQLSAEQLEILRAHYYMRTQDSSVQILEKLEADIEGRQ